MGWIKLLLSACVLALAVFLGYRQFRAVTVTLPDPDAWWGPGDADSAISNAIRPFKIDISKDAIDDLKSRLLRTRFFEPLDDAHFQYGFNQRYLRDIVTYWKDRYDWFKWQSTLNRLPQFMTTIQGLDVHFVHLKAESTAALPRAAIILLHGWPGSFVEFYKAAPMLQATAEKDAGVLLDVVVPSIPGYGFSAAASKQGFGSIAAAHVFGVLMERLGYGKYFVQGGDWGGIIGQAMTVQRPDRVLGFHSNFPVLPSANANLAVVPLMLLESIAPSLIMSDAEYQFVQRRKGGFTSFKDVALERGYILLQLTKPDTVGSALVDSPAGLAAYILEKFSTWTNGTNRDLEDGGLTKAFLLDELLTNVMIYWFSGNVASSMRFYKEFFKAAYANENVILTVPTGVANFPMELSFVPRIMAALTRSKLVHFSLHETGGHFPAFQLPVVYCADVVQFIKTVQQLPAAV